MRYGRWWLLLIYALATVMAQGGHNHGDGERPPTRAGIACDEPRTHVEAHPATPGDRHLDSCLACQYRAQSHWDELAAPLLDLTPAALATELPGPTAYPVSTRRPSCRAPPRA